MFRPKHAKAPVGRQVAEDKNKSQKCPLLFFMFCHAIIKLVRFHCVQPQACQGTHRMTKCRKVAEGKSYHKIFPFFFFVAGLAEIQLVSFHCVQPQACQSTNRYTKKRRHVTFTILILTLTSFACLCGLDVVRAGRCMQAGRQAGRRAGKQAGRQACAW